MAEIKLLGNRSLVINAVHLVYTDDQIVYVIKAQMWEKSDKDAYRILMESLSEGFNVRDVTCKPSEANN
jgi:hypothetical protein